MMINKLILLSAIALCVACAPATPSKEDLNDQLENTIANESELWAKLNIDSYQITVNHSSVWVEYSLIIKVENNEVVDSKASCGDALLEDSGFCNKVISDISPEDYTIRGLFDDLKNHAGPLKQRIGEDNLSQAGVRVFLLLLIPNTTIR